MSLAVFQAMQEKAVIPRLVNTATTLKQSVRHHESGLSVMVEPTPTDADPDAITVVIAFLDEALPGMLTLRTAELPSDVDEDPKTNINSSQVNIVTTSTTSAVKQKTREDSLRWICPRLERDSFEVSQPTAAECAGIKKRSLGQLFSDDGQAVLLEAVLQHVAAGTIIRLTEVCKNAGLIISKSARAQLKLRKLFHAVGPYDILRCDTAPPGVQLAWLLEREHRTERVQTHWGTLVRGSSQVYDKIDEGFLLSHSNIMLNPESGTEQVPGGIDENGKPNSRKVNFIFDTNTEEEILMMHHPPMRCKPWLYRLDTHISETAISAKDDLMVRVQMHALAGVESTREQVIWRFQFCRMKSDTFSDESQGEYSVESHPRARLPFVDVVIPAFEWAGAELDLKLGPNGLLLFSCYHKNERMRQVTVILDWIKGEARGYIDTDHEDASTLSHAFVNGDYLISAISGLSRKRSYETDIKGEKVGVGASQPGRWAALWLWSLPQQGRRAEDYKTVCELPDDTGRYTSTPVIYYNTIERLMPEVSFDLPPMSDPGQTDPTSQRHEFDLRGTRIDTSRSSAEGLGVNGNLALFTFTGRVSDRLSQSRVRPVQFCGVVQVSKLVDAWQRAQGVENRTVPRAARTRRIANCKEHHVPPFAIAWQDWQQWTHVFTLNSHLRPVFHGTKLIVGFCPREEQEAFAPTIPADASQGYGIPFTELKFAIRDFNTNRLAHPGLRPWHKMGVPLTHPSQPKLDECGLTECALDTIGFESHCVTRGPAHRTRGMFLDPVIRGGLKYNEVIVKTGVTTQSKMSQLLSYNPYMRKVHPEDETYEKRVGVVETMLYDGETLVLQMFEAAWCLELGTRRYPANTCCKFWRDHRKVRKDSPPTLAEMQEWYKARLAGSPPSSPSTAASDSS